MVTLSTRGRYGTRLMVDLAVYGGDTPVLLKDIARREKLSVGYLERIVPLLKKDGLIRSVRGARGGYLLRAKPAEITLGRILRALEGYLGPTKCAKTPSACRRGTLCAAHGIWEKIADDIGATLDKVTLKDMAEE
jgi:Rrf2 family protein